MPDYKRLIAAAKTSRLDAVLILMLFLHLLLASPALAETRVCSQGCANSTIAEALNASSTDETIVVESGTYSEMPIIGKKINLHGLDTGDGKPILVPPDGGRAILAAYGAVLSGFEIGREKDRSGSSAEGGDSDEGDCALEVILPASIYLNDFLGNRSVCAEDAAIWNSSAGINYQFNSRVLRSRLGNYWADYKGNDSDGNGVGDLPYILNDKNIDYYPLMQPAGNYRIANEKETTVELIKARVGEPFTISLPSNPTTGYDWTTDYDYGLLKLENASFERDDQKALRVGAGGTSVFVFTPIGAGKTTIYFVYKRSWENIAADTRSFHVAITA